MDFRQTRVESGLKCPKSRHRKYAIEDEVSSRSSSISHLPILSFSPSPPHLAPLHFYPTNSSFQLKLKFVVRWLEARRATMSKERSSQPNLASLRSQKVRIHQNPSVPTKSPFNTGILAKRPKTRQTKSHMSNHPANTELAPKTEMKPSLATSSSEKAPSNMNLITSFKFSFLSFNRKNMPTLPKIPPSV